MWTRRGPARLPSVCAALAWVLAASLSPRIGFSQEEKTPEMIPTTRDNVTVVCPAASERLREHIMAVCADTRKCLAPLYGLAPDHPVKANWIPRSRYAEFTRTEYGFPSNSKNGEILPAADLDLPTSLAKIVDILDLPAERAEDMARFKKLAGLPEGATTDDVLRFLRTSKEFYCRYCINFILPHEIAHDFNIAARTPVRPKWLHEWQAQFAAVLACRAAGRDDDADLFVLYYRMIYRGGKAKVAHKTMAECNELGAKMGVENYAWFHGGLIEMFCQLESAHGPQLGPKVLDGIRRTAQGKQEITNPEIIGIVSRAAGVDLTDWFEKTWGIK